MPSTPLPTDPKHYQSLLEALSALKRQYNLQVICFIGVPAPPDPPAPIVFFSGVAPGKENNFLRLVLQNMPEKPAFEALVKLKKDN